MESWQLLLLAALGLIAGVLNVIAGGGSLVTLPAMIFMGLPESVANGTNRVAILAQNVSAVTSFRKRGFSDFRLSLTLALAAIPGSIMGAYAGVVIRGEWFNRILAVIMIGSMVFMIWKQRRARQRASNDSFPSTSKRTVWGHVGMIGVGFYGGFIQAGVGFLLMGVLNGIMRLDLVRVNMHKVFVVAAFSLPALIVYVAHGKVWWIPGLSLAVGNTLGGWFGARLSVTKGEGFIRGVLYVALTVMAVKLMLG